MDKQKEKILNNVKILEVSDLAKFLYTYRINEETVNKLMSENGITNQTSLYKVKQAYSRINMSLSKVQMIAYFILPIGTISSFTDGYPKFAENGYLKKEKQFLICSWAGVAFYLIVAFIIKIL